MDRRLKMLTLLVHGSLFWCSGSWNLTNDQLGNLKDLQQKMMRKMIGMKRPEEMEIAEYMTKTNGTIKRLKAKYGIRDWDIVALRNHFGWAGHFSRLAAEDPSRLAGKVLHYRDRQWLDRIEFQNYGRQLLCRKLRIWRWERPMANMHVLMVAAPGMN